MTRSYTDADLAAVRASRRPAWAEIIRITQAAIANNDAKKGTK